MDQSTAASLNKEWSMGRENITLLTATCTVDNGNRMWLMGVECFDGQMEHSMMVSGKTMSLMAKESIHGSTEERMKVSTSKERSMAKENTDGQKDIFIKEIGKMDTNMEMDIYKEADKEWMDFGLTANSFISKIPLK